MMQSIASFFWLAVFGLAGVTTATANPSAVFQGTAHDAFYGLCYAGNNWTAVGQAGLVVTSRDAGKAWKILPSFTDKALLDVSCNDEVSLAVGQEGIIYRQTQNAFEPVVSPTNARLMAVSEVLADGFVVAVGGFGTILISQDAGQNWRIVSVDWQSILNDAIEPHLYDVSVSSSGQITIVGEFELVLTSDDFGRSWRTRNLGEASLFSVTIHDDGKGYAVGQDGRILKTLNGSESWEALENPSDGILLNIWSSADGKVLVSGIRNLLTSNNGGASWTKVQSGDFMSGWYQGLWVGDAANEWGRSALLAGHQGNLIRLKLD
ncbi:hypothetical protein OA101_01240 [Alphaproteobacteria bacterium]|nr:hypothetical protein [Alphaproteobacteria bacterium]